MAKVASKEKRILDIALMLEKGLERKEILQELSKNFKVSSRTIDSEIKEAKNIVSERNKQRENIRQEKTSQALKDELNKALKSDLELEAHLCKIAFGEIEVEDKQQSDQFGLTTFKRKPTASEMTKAIDVLFKKRGVYVTKQQTEITVSKPIIIDWTGEYNNTDTETKGSI